MCNQASRQMAKINRLFTITIVLVATARYTGGSIYHIPPFGLTVCNTTDVTEVTMVMTTEEPQNVTISGTATNSSIQTVSFSYPDSVRRTYTLTGLPLLRSSMTGSDSLKIKTTGQNKVLMLTHYAGYYEGFRGIAYSNIGKEYYVTTFCGLGGYCQITIATSQTGTTKIYLDLPSTTDEEIMYCYSNSFWKSGRDKVLSLEYPDSVQITSRRDLSGTHIYSDQEVAVLAGTHSVENGNDIYHYLEMFSPVNHWGKHFVFRTIGDSSYGNLVAITAAEDDTRVTMNGYQDITMSAGQFVNRRVVSGDINTIYSTCPIQVVLFTGIVYNVVNASNSELVMVNPGMTMVPAVEHTKSQSEVACLNSGGTKPNIQFVTPTSVAFSYYTVLRDEYVPYTEHRLYEIEPDSSVLDTPHSFSIKTVGFLTCEGTALMSSINLRINDGSCTADVRSMAPGDEVDNDCDGETDEDYCFESKEIESVYTEPDGDIEPHTEDISGFQSLKLRLVSICNLTNIDLSDGNNGSVFIQITTRSITFNAILPNTAYQYAQHNMSDYVFECDRIYPFWLVQTNTSLCFDLGPVPPSDCSNQNLTVNTTERMTSMAVGGVFSNVTYWIDLYRPDCGKLHSTWRCGDLVSNCSDYGTAMCTDYPVWAQAYCGECCGICLPDSYGHVFVFTLPPSADAYAIKEISVVSRNPSNTSHPTIGIGLTSNSDLENGITFLNRTMMTANGDTITYQVIDVTEGATDNSNIYLYSDDDVRVIVDYKLVGNFYPRLVFPVEPLDTTGIEYMTSFLQTSITCHIIAHDGRAEVSKFTSASHSTIATIEEGDKYVITLNEPEHTGTVILANRPVTVFCGSTDLQYTWQQLRATHTWGRDYVIPPTYDVTITRITTRIITNSDYTVVILRGDLEHEFLLNKRGDYLDEELQHNITYTITANRPISVGVEHKSSTNSTYPFSWIVLPPTLNFLNASEFFMPSPMYMYDSATIPSVNSNGAASDKIFPISNAQYDALYVGQTDNSSVYMLGGITTGSVVPFFIGSSTKFADLTPTYTCTLSASNEVNDGVDNDCDGLVDEDVCYTGYGAELSDRDGDWAFGEDCSSISEGTPVYELPRKPVCIVNVSDPGCWMVCDCQCSWVTNLKAYDKMTPEQQDVYNYNVTSKIVTNLTINKASLSSEITKLEATEDERTSAQNMGYVGYIILSLTVLMLVFFDVLSLWTYLRRVFPRSKAVIPAA